MVASPDDFDKLVAGDAVAKCTVKVDGRIVTAEHKGKFSETGIDLTKLYKNIKH